MRKNFNSYFFFISVTAMISCTENQKMVTSQRSVADTVSYADFWDAILGFDTSYASKNQVNPDEHSFSEAFKLMLTGEKQRFIDTLKRLHDFTEDTLVRDYCNQILTDHYFYKFDWNKLLELEEHYYASYKAQPDSNAIKYKELYKKLKTLSPTKYNFQNKTDTIPMLDIADNCPVIQIAVNGTKKNFLFDTGAGMTTLISDSTQQYGIYPVVPTQFTVGTITDISIFSQYAVGNFNIGNLEIMHSLIMIDKEESYAMLHDDYPYSIDGIIGWDIIQNLDVTIDYPGRKLIIRKPEEKGNRNPNLFNLIQPIVKISSAQGLPFYFLYDTGANKSHLTQEIKRKVVMGSLEKRKIEKGGAGGFQETEVEIVPEIKLMINAKEVICNEISIEESSNLFHLDGALGGDIALNAKLHFDYTNGIFEFIK